MTPLESEVLQQLGLDHLRNLEAFSIYVFFYGEPSSLAVWGSSPTSVSGVFVVLFFASVVIFVFVFSFRKATYSWSPKLGRRKGFFNRATGAMFAATVINFLLSSLNTAIQVASLVVFIRKALILGVDYPLSEKPELVKNALRNVNLVGFCAGGLPVSIKLSLSDPISIHARWRYCSAILLSSGGLGHSFQIKSG